MCTQSPLSSLTRLKAKSLGNLIVYSDHGKREAKHWGHMSLQFCPWERVLFHIWGRHQKQSYSVHAPLITMLVFLSHLFSQSPLTEGKHWGHFILVAFSKTSYRKKKILNIIYKLFSLWPSTFLLFSGVGVLLFAFVDQQPCHFLKTICILPSGQFIQSFNQYLLGNKRRAGVS